MTFIADAISCLSADDDYPEQDVDDVPNRIIYSSNYCSGPTLWKEIANATIKSLSVRNAVILVASDIGSYEFIEYLKQVIGADAVVIDITCKHDAYQAYDKANRNKAMKKFNDEELFI
jgi:hypothetical protein